MPSLPVHFNCVLLELRAGSARVTCISSVTTVCVTELMRSYPKRITAQLSHSEVYFAACASKDPDPPFSKHQSMDMVRCHIAARLIESVKFTPRSPFLVRAKLILSKLAVLLKYLWKISRPSIANLVTLPYYRFYRQNTLLPILAIKRSVEARESDEVIFERLRNWQDRKLAEYKFIAAAVMAPFLFAGFPRVWVS